jgi:shikimate kinase
MTTIAFIGFRGSGKTTLGRWLAKELQVPFFDTDEEVLRYLGFKTVLDAWEHVGEQGWRDAEFHVIPPLLEKEGVVSLGGGAPMIHAVKKALGTTAIVFNLTASEEVTKGRISCCRDRPELKAGNKEARLNRLSTYAMFSTCGIDTSGDLDTSKSQILHFLEYGQEPPNNDNKPKN